MKRPDEQPSTAAPGKWPDEGWAKKYPALCEFLGDDRWDDGTPREVATLGLKTEDMRIVASLNDHSSARSLYRSGETVEGALRALDKACVDPGADWRAWKGGHKSRRK